MLMFGKLTVRLREHATLLELMRRKVISPKIVKLRVETCKQQNTL